MYRSRTSSMTRLFASSTRTANWMRCMQPIEGVKIDGWWDALERSGNNVWRQHILRVERNEGHAARGCDQRHCRRYVLAFILWPEHDPNLQRIILNHGVQYRRCSRRADIDLADKILWANPFARGQAMVC